MTTQQTTDLASWLLLQVEADEEAARAADAAFKRGPGTPPDWTSKRQWERADPEVAAFIRSHDPARVLAECAAKRAIVELHDAAIKTLDEPTRDPEWRTHGQRYCRMCHDYYEHDGVAWPCPTLRALASVYADHDGFREEWR